VSRRLLLIAAMWAVLVGVGVSVGSADAQSGERFVLTGVVFVEGGGGRAWLQEPTLTQNQVVTVRPGESIGPYRLTKILEDRVEMEGPAGKVSVRLAGAPGPATAAAHSSAQGTASTPDVAHPAPTIAPPPVDLRTDPSKKFDFGSFPSLLMGGRP
jgi:hypothetical protein